MYKPRTRVDGQPIQTDLNFVSYIGPRYLRERGGDFTDTTLTSKLGATGIDTLLLFPPDISGISIDGINEEPEIRLTEIPQLADGRKNSRNGVRFGQLHISSETSKPVAELVAAKYIHKLTAPREFNAARVVNHRHGDAVAFQPVGFVRGENDMVGYLSRYEHSVTSLDNILWNESSSVAQREHAMGFAGLWLATLHNVDIIHGDAQAKNVAYDSAQQPRYPDLEGAHDLAHGEFDSTTERLLDIGDFFNPVYMPRTTADEEAIFVDAYLDHQHTRPIKLDGEDIIDTIRSQQEQAY